jgi:hypothetical protein
MASMCDKSLIHGAWKERFGGSVDPAAPTVGHRAMSRSTTGQRVTRSASKLTAAAV